MQRLPYRDKQEINRIFAEFLQRQEPKTCNTEVGLGCSGGIKPLRGYGGVESEKPKAQLELNLVRSMESNSPWAHLTCSQWC